MTTEPNKQISRRIAEQQVTRQFWPERLALMTAFPMTPSGKVQKFRLQALLQATPAPVS